MLQNWLKPLAATPLKLADKLPASAFGQNILLHRKELPDLKGVRVALLGIEEKEANEVRHCLYTFASHFPKDAVADLGNLRKASPEVLIPVLFELLSGRVLPVILGKDDIWARAQFLAYQEAKALANLAVVDERLRFSLLKGDTAEVYTPLLVPRHPLLFHFSLIGFQTHQAPPTALDFLQKNNYDALRLGRSRVALEETEPIIRDADLLAFHLGALKQTEAPGVESATPSGFFLEEACQLCRYAGMSDKLTSFGIYGFNAALDQQHQSAQAISQLIWYFLEGFFNRKNDYPHSTSGLTEYVVDFPSHNYQLTFWKSMRSGRWWMQVPVDTKRKHQRHRLIPCSFQDYQAACREELPERLWAAFKRF